MAKKKLEMVRPAALEPALPDVQIIHLGTQVVTQFGVVTAAGDTLQFPPIQLKVDRLSAEAFNELLGILTEQRELAKQQILSALKGQPEGEKASANGSDSAD